jgi:Cytochrome c peroxidase
VDLRNLILSNTEQGTLRIRILVFFSDMGGLGKRLDWNGITSILIHSLGEVSMFLFRIFLWSVLSFSLVSQVPWIQAQEPIQSIEEMTPKNRNLVELGKMLYFDPRLSKSGFISCNSCHNLSMGDRTTYRLRSITIGPRGRSTRLPSSTRA